MLLPGSSTQQRSSTLPWATEGASGLRLLGKGVVTPTAARPGRASGTAVEAWEAAANYRMWLARTTDERELIRGLDEVTANRRSWNARSASERQLFREMQAQGRGIRRVSPSLAAPNGLWRPTQDGYAAEMAANARAMMETAEAAELAAIEAAEAEAEAVAAEASASNRDWLPRGWIAGVDPSSGDLYYKHQASGTMQWDPPEPERSMGRTTGRRQEMSPGQGMADLDPFARTLGQHGERQSPPGMGQRGDGRRGESALRGGLYLICISVMTRLMAVGCWLLLTAAGYC